MNSNLKFMIINGYKSQKKMIVSVFTPLGLIMVQFFIVKIIFEEAIVLNNGLYHGCVFSFGNC